MTDAGVKRARAEKTAGATPGGGDSGDTDSDVEEVIGNDDEYFCAIERAMQAHDRAIKAVNEEMVALRVAFESLRELTETKYTSLLALWGAAQPTLQLMKDAEERRQRAMQGPKPKQFVTKEDVLAILQRLQDGCSVSEMCGNE